MSHPMDRAWNHLYLEMKRIAQGHVDTALSGIVSGGKVLASSVAGTLPFSAFLHAMQSPAHSDADHTTLPNNGDVWTYNATTQTWGPASLSAVGAGSPETLVIPGDPPEPVVADGDYIYVAYS